MTADVQREPYRLCPLCGLEFRAEDALCHHGCPLHAHCRLVRCPSCGYEFAEVPRGPSWLRRLFRRRRAPANGNNGEACGLLSLSELRAGERAEVVTVGRRGRTGHGTLALFGLVPGGEVTLIQRRPACVVRIGETELALEGDVASDILVRPADRDAVEPTG